MVSGESIVGLQVGRDSEVGFAEPHDGAPVDSSLALEPGTAVGSLPSVLDGSTSALADDEYG